MAARRSPSPKRHAGVAPSEVGRDGGESDSAEHGTSGVAGRHCGLRSCQYAHELVLDCSAGVYTSLGKG